MTEICKGCELAERLLNGIKKIGFNFEPIICVKCYNSKGEIIDECSY